MSSGKHKLIILNYYDSLVNRVDVYTEEQLEIYTNEHLIEIKDIKKEEEGENENFDLNTATDLLSKETKQKIFSPNQVKEKPISDYAVKINWSQNLPFEMGAQDYLNFMRDELINQIEKAKKETLEYYETIKDELKQNEMISDENELKKKLFEKKSAFLFSRPHSNLNPFTLYLVIFNFYFDDHQEELLKYFYE